MKKVFLLVAAAIVCMSANAQFQIGGKVGFDMTNYWGADVEHGMKPGYQFGAIMQYKFNDRFAIAPEVVFASQGGKSKALAIEVDDDFESSSTAIFLEAFRLSSHDTRAHALFLNFPVFEGFEFLAILTEGQDGKGKKKK